MAAPAPAPEPPTHWYGYQTLALGIAGSMVLDATLLAREPVAQDPGPATPPHAGIIPVMTISPEGRGGARALAGATIVF